MGATIGLVNAGVRDLGGAPRLAFDQGKREHRNRAAFMNDDASAQIEIGKLLILSGDFAEAAKSVEAARRLEPNIAGGSYFLALARLGEGRDQDALRLLRAIPKDDPHRGAADIVLRRLGAES
jgi:tetratricopeptide (TPR) repeat protein